MVRSSSSASVAHTAFTTSLGILMVIVVGPLLSWYCLTSPEVIAKKHLSLPRSQAMGVTFSILVGIIIISNLICCHPRIKTDQIIYNYGFSWLICCFYVSGWYWPDGTRHLLLRTVIAVGFVIVGLLVGATNSIMHQKIRQWHNRDHSPATPVKT